MKNRGPVIAIALACAVSGLVGTASATGSSIDDISWLAGTWIGLGSAGTADEGAALSVWTAPQEGVMSWTFRWSQPARKHVHFAFSVFQQSGGEVFGRGIHHDRNFEAYEDAPWKLQLVEATAKSVYFQCIENCRGKGVRLTSLNDGGLEEAWTSLEGQERHFVVTYHRAGN